MFSCIGVWFGEAAGPPPPLPPPTSLPGPAANKNTNKSRWCLQAERPVFLGCVFEVSSAPGVLYYFALRTRQSITRRVACVFRVKNIIKRMSSSSMRHAASVINKL
jgi:hypothetical protein